MKRIQRRRTKGWRMPEGAIYVGRPTRWGNPAGAGQSVSISSGRRWFTWIASEEDAIALFRQWLAASLEVDPAFLDPLRGHDLACWCPLDQSCHADVLLELANR